MSRDRTIFMRHGIQGAHVRTDKGIDEAKLREATQEIAAAFRDMVSRRLARRQDRIAAMPNWRPTYVTASGAFTNIAGLPRKGQG